MTDTWTPCLPPPKPPIARQHCRHYGYSFGVRGGPSCEAGVDNKGATAPCMPDPTTPCVARSEWTATERAAWQAWMKEHTERMVVVMTAIPQEGSQGVVDCPGCGMGTVRWSRAARNRHLHAACTTPHCFSVMQ